MDKLRKVFEWLGSHKIVSAVITLVIVGVSVWAKYVATVSAGELSPPIQRGDIVDAVYGIGTVTAYHRLSFNPLVGSSLDRSYVLEGDHVKKGQSLLYTVEGGTATAPFDGIVNFAPYRTGENVYSTAPMMILTDFNHLYVLVSMEQQGALRVQAGQTARISFDSARDRTYEGKVSAIYSYSSNFLARIDNMNFPPSILPDMTCDVGIVIGVHKNALLIPVTAFENGKVWVKRGHAIPHAVAVTLGVSDGTNAEILSGEIQPGDRVLIHRQVGP